MTDHLISLVTDQDGNQVFLHVDLAGVDMLLSELNYIKAELEKNDCPHSHLYSEDWGGSGLTATKLKDHKDEVNCVHHLKIYGWNSAWKKKHELV